MTASAINPETLNTDFILVGIPVVNDTLHAASIRGVRIRAKTEFLGYGVCVDHGENYCVVVECETRETAFVHRTQIVRDWRVGLREHVRLVALAAAAAAAADNKGAN